MDVSVETLSQFLMGAGDTRLKHVETQTDLTRDTTNRGDAGVEQSIQLVFQGELKEKPLELDVDSESSLETVKSQMLDGASVSAAVLAEVLERVFDHVKLEDLEVLKKENREVACERDNLEILLRKETSARIAAAERLVETESIVKSVAEEVSRRMTEARLELEKKSSSLNAVEADLDNERAQTALLERKIVSCGRVLADMIILSRCLSSAVSEGTKKYEKAVDIFKATTRCLKKQLRRQVRRINGVNEMVRQESHCARNFFLVRGTSSLKRLRKRKLNIVKALRRRVRHAIWHSVVFQENTSVKTEKPVAVAKRRRKQTFSLVFSELKKHVTRLKSRIEKQDSKLLELESENEELHKEKTKIFMESELRIRELTEQLTALRNSNPIRNEMRKVGLEVGIEGCLILSGLKMPMSRELNLFLCTGKTCKSVKCGGKKDWVVAASRRNQPCSRRFGKREE